MAPHSMVDLLDNYNHLNLSLLRKKNKDYRMFCCSRFGDQDDKSTFSFFHCNKSQDPNEKLLAKRSNFRKIKQYIFDNLFLYFQNYN